ncbi:WW domain-containing protein [Melia azedarach]|uniref:WW domain-containing protein n=1 Tax=Melia azedarach TaxID=155640 RepID=A0ACC1WQF3_MELAZ|nr:WW domain-containing protein [Melia azedarach]
MVSFQAPISPNSRKTNAEFDNFSRKRKLEELEGEETLDKRSKAESTKSIFDIELHLETPLPLEWERCLDIQSGQIHFYNTRTQKKTSGDPRGSPEPPNPAGGHMSLDLELNLLPCDSQRKNQTNKHNSASLPSHLDISKQEKQKSSDLTRCPSWLAFEGDQQEMVATACMRCHMLVMLCKSSPTCPNCKFVHPPDQTPPKLFKQGLSLLC